MAVPNPSIMRGIAIPDCNFRWPPGDSWGLGPGAVGKAKAGMSTDHNIGRTMIIDVYQMAHQDGTDYIQSEPTPYGVASGPYTNIDTRGWWYGAIARVNNVTGAAAGAMLKMRLKSFDADGVVIGAPFGDTYFRKLVDTSGDALGESTDHSDFTMFQASIVWPPDTAARYYEATLSFEDSADGSGVDGEEVELAWVGAACTAWEGGVYTPDNLETWYAQDASISTRNLAKRITGANRYAPLIDVQQPAHMQQLGLTFPMLTEADRTIIRTAAMWNMGTPTADVKPIEGRCVDRGTSQPVIVVLNRAGVKRAFYADFAPQFLQSLGYWPETSARYNTQVQFIERPF